jgi:hypothetical protein
MMAGCLPTRPQLETAGAEARQLVDELETEVVELRGELAAVRDELELIEDPRIRHSVAGQIAAGESMLEQLELARSQAEAVVDAVEVRLSQLPPGSSDADALSAGLSSAGAAIGGPVGIGLGLLGVASAGVVRILANRELGELVGALEVAEGPLVGVSMSDRSVRRELRQLVSPGTARRVDRAARRAAKGV